MDLPSATIPGRLRALAPVAMITCRRYAVAGGQVERAASIGQTANFGLRIEQGDPVFSADAERRRQPASHLA